MSRNSEFDIQGVCHVALVCSDMAKTVEFYTEVLGMTLAKTVEIPGGGQHFFFDMGCGEYVAFFWFPDAPERAPGIASPRSYPGLGDELMSAHGSMNHLSFRVPLERFEEYVERLHEKGVKTGPILNHDDSEWTVSAEVHDGTFIRSVYFMDPDGILLEFSAWTKEVGGPEDIRHAPATADGTRKPLVDV